MIKKITSLFALAVSLVLSCSVFAQNQLIVDNLSAQTEGVNNVFRWWLKADGDYTLKSASFETSSSKSYSAGNSEMMPSDLNCYLLMVDTSKSMKAHWANAQQAINIWLDMVPQSSAIYGFAESLYAISPFNSAQSLDELKEKVRGISLSGKDTQLYLAINDALQASDNCSGVRKHLVVFSDGDAEDKAHTLSEVVQKAVDANVTIHTLGVGDLNKARTALKLEILKTLASKTGGDYQHWKNTESLATAVGEEILTHKLGGVVTLDESQLPYGTDQITLVITLEDRAGSEVRLTHPVSITGADKQQNILLLISEKTGVSDPWLVIAGVCLLLLLLLSLRFYGKAKRKRDAQAKRRNEDELKKQEAEKQIEYRKKQEQNFREMQQALDSVNKKIEDFNPGDAVQSDGEPFGWLRDKHGISYQLVKFSSTIGRSDENDVAVKDSHISSQHAILDFKKGVFIWTDRAPLNKSKVNGEVVRGSASVKPGDTITCGKTELEFILA